MTGRERGVNSALQAGHGQLLWFSKFACDACWAFTGRLRSLKCRAIFVSLWKLIEEKEWSAVLASLNHFDHHALIFLIDHDWSASCLCPHDLMMYPSDCLIFPSLRVSRLSHVCVYPHDCVFNPMFLFTCFDARNPDGCPILICWRGCIGLACQYITCSKHSFFSWSICQVFTTSCCHGHTAPFLEPPWTFAWWGVSR